MRELDHRRGCARTGLAVPALQHHRFAAVQCIPHGHQQRCAGNRRVLAGGDVACPGPRSRCRPGGRAGRLAVSAPGLRWRIGWPRARRRFFQSRVRCRFLRPGVGRGIREPGTRWGILRPGGSRGIRRSDGFARCPARDSAGPVPDERRRRGRQQHEDAQGEGQCKRGRDGVEVRRRGGCPTRASGGPVPDERRRRGRQQHEDAQGEA